MKTSIGVLFLLLLCSLAFAQFTDIATTMQAIAYGSSAWGDFDNDSDLDLLICGNGNVSTKIYRNDNGTFVDIVAGLPGVNYGCSAWGDYDNDGYLDLILTGSTLSFGQIARVYHNNGNSTFTDIAAGINGVQNSTTAWGDYDNDGDLDILLAGASGTATVTQIWANNGNGTFSLQTTGLLGLSWSSAAWGDYDNDGDLDIAIEGRTAAFTYMTQIYRNDGANTFTDIAAGLVGVNQGDIDWGDYDADGDLDILLVGQYYVGSTRTVVAKVYRNNNNGTFTDIAATLAGVSSSTAAWGDYDDDGDLDILLNGSNSTYASITKVYRNNAGTYADLGVTLTGTNSGSVSWADYNNDGKLDILLSGTGSTTTKIYRNDYAVTNTIPSTPTNLSTFTSGGYIVFNWDASTDTQTPGPGLNYVLRIGTASGGSQISVPMSTSPGYHQVAQRGYANGTHSWKILSSALMAQSNYYWSVQAIDGAFKGSAFAAEAILAVASIPPAAVNPVPADLATAIAIDTPLSWDTVSGATSYDVYFGTVLPGTPNANVLVSTWTPPLLDNGTVYYWMVVPKNSMGDAVDNVTWSFTTIYAVPVAAQNPVPTDVAVNVPIDAGLSWDPVIQATSYDVYFGTTLPGVPNVNVTSPTWTPPTMLNGTTYQWMVVPRNPDFVAIGCPTWSFTTILSLPLAAVNPVPANLANNVAINASLSWDAVDGATNYDVYFGTILPGSPTANVTTPTWTPPTMQNSTVYHWMVVPRNIVGDAINTPTWSFTTVALPVQQFTDIATTMQAIAYGSSAWGDFDNDSDLDLLICGNGNVSTKIYRNDNGTFVDIVAGLPGVNYGCSAWGDYDNDGYLDFILTGNTLTLGQIASVYHNNGDGTFTDIAAGINGVQNSTTSWGDYDNDGDLDILLAGVSGSATVTQIWANNGNGTFSLQTTGLLGLSWSSAAWGDYDNDGDLDIAIEGRTAAFTYMTQIYRNDGANTFTDIAAGLVGVNQGDIDWGDYDADGDLDILLIGHYYVGTTRTVVAKIYSNNNDGTFTDIAADLPGVSLSTAAWGDYDDDGDLDILMNGSNDTYANITKVFRNDAGTYADLGVTLPGTNSGSVSWADYNNDGKLDILLSGTGSPTTKIFRNDYVVTNTVPAAPTNLATTVSGDYIVFNWDASTDTQTPSAGLNYVLRIGTTSGGQEITAPMSTSPGYHQVAQRGYANGTHSWKILASALTAQSNYYWSVQAIDGAFKGSAFATEDSFTVVLSIDTPLNPVILSASGICTLTWDTVPLATSYNVYYSLEPYPAPGGWTLLNNYTCTSCTVPYDTDVRCFYRVTALR